LCGVTPARLPMQCVDSLPETPVAAIGRRRVAAASSQLQLLAAVLVRAREQTPRVQPAEREHGKAATRGHSEPVGRRVADEVEHPPVARHRRQIKEQADGRARGRRLWGHGPLRGGGKREEGSRVRRCVGNRKYVEFWHKKTR